MSPLVNIITAADPATRNRSLDAFGRAASLPDLLAECDALEQFWRSSDNLYERVRALLFCTPSTAFTCRSTRRARRRPHSL